MPYPWETANLFNQDWNQASYDPGVVDNDFAALTSLLLANWQREMAQAHTGPGNTPGLSAAFTSRMAQRGGDLQNQFLLQKALGNAAFTDDSQWDTRLGEQLQADARGNRRLQDVGRWGSGRRALNALRNQINSGTMTGATQDILADQAQQGQVVNDAVLSGTNPLLARGRSNRLTNAYNVWKTTSGTGDFITYAHSLGLL